MNLQPEQMLAHYRLVGKIGEGGMGVVWKALDTKLNRHVAIKILPPGLTENAERRLRFQREAQAAAALDHPNIAVIHEIGEHEGAPYIAMQLLEGESLRSRLKGQALPVEDWLRLAIPIVEGLAHAHAAGIVHRDLKPDNVMLTKDGQVKLLDFGLAKLLHPEKLPEPSSQDVHTRLETISHELTKAGKVFGTVAYMSPEQARGKTVDHRSDIFSLGVMLYQMATGRLPFRGDSDVESLSATITQEAAPLSEIVGEIPHEAERVVRKALEKSPESRYQHADDLATDLRNLRRDLDSGRASIPSGVGTRPVSGVAPTAPAGRALPRWLLPVAGGLVLAAAAVYGSLWLADRPAPGRETGAAAAGAGSRAREGADTRKRIVVLPFENLGDSEDQVFAAGLTDELISRLSRVQGLGVISRSSAFQYDRTGKSMGRIGDDFDVEYVLEGTVRWAGPAGGSRQIRISPQLVRTSDDTSLWAGSYDRTMENIFEIQSEIASAVIDQLGVVLLDSERSAVESRPTDSAEAYQAYLKGLHYLARVDQSESDQRLAVQMFELAVKEDPDFALAQAALSRSHSALVHWGYERTDQRKRLARSAAERALALAPEAPEAHLAMGYYYYWCNKDYPPALREFARAREQLPRSPELLTAIAYVERRQGEWDSAVAHLEEAVALSPTDPQMAQDLSETLVSMRRYDEALAVVDRAISLGPDLSIAYINKARIYWLRDGDLRKARAVLESKPHTADGRSLWTWYLQEIFEGDPEAALARLEESLIQAYSIPGTYVPATLMKALALDLSGRREEAREAFEASLRGTEAMIRERPDDFRLYGTLGLALAGLGRKEEALEAGEKGAEMYPVSADANAGTEPLKILLWIQALVGDDEGALDTVETVVSVPAFISLQQIRLNPWLKPLVSLPRFAELERRARRG